MFDLFEGKEEEATTFSMTYIKCFSDTNCQNCTRSNITIFFIFLDLLPGSLFFTCHVLVLYNKFSILEIIWYQDFNQIRHYNKEEPISRGYHSFVRPSVVLGAHRPTYWTAGSIYIKLRTKWFLGMSYKDYWNIHVWTKNDGSCSAMSWVR